jgi:lysozyme
MTAPPGPLFGPDISNNDFGGPDDPDLDAAAAFVNALPGEGFSWVEAKCSMGSDFIDPTWATIYQTATAIGLLIVAYHYLDTTDAAAQAQTCAAALNGADVPVMFDFEDDGGDFENFLAVLAAFQAAGLNVALSYIPAWYWEDIGEPDISSAPGLVSSSYPTTASGYAETLYDDGGGDDGEGWDGYGGGTPVIWQFTDAAIVAGLDVDCNAFQGSLDDLQTLLGVTGGNPFMALTDQQQEDLYNWAMWTFQQLAGVLTNNPGNVTALPGSPTPTGSGWPQLGQNAAGENLTPVDALAAVKTTIETPQENS